jgi:hypothetical protein
MPRLRLKTRLALPQIKSRLGKSVFAAECGTFLVASPAVFELTSPERFSLCPRTPNAFGHRSNS